MKKIDTHFNGLFVIKREPLNDPRGSFERLYCEQTFREFGINNQIQQANLSYTKEKATVRGLHFQIPPYSEIKIVTCIKGIVFDVALDLRINSPTYLQTFSIELSSEKSDMVVIPEGFAHGFQTLTDHCQLLYIHTNNYAPEFESGLNACDPALSINWPYDVRNRSSRDLNFPFIDQHFNGIEV